MSTASNTKHPNSSTSSTHPQAIKQNLYTLDKIATKMLNEYKNKNDTLEAGLNKCKMYETKK
jgi:hypothetical protein